MECEDRQVPKRKIAEVAGILVQIKEESNKMSAPFTLSQQQT